LVRQDKELERLDQEFVCVRLVQMKGVDLELFQFDYDQTWAAFFLNADGTIYGRYGTRAGTKTNATTHISIPSLKKAMQRALELHKGYPANKAQLAGKRGGPVEYRFIDKQILGGGKGHHHCFHCHHVTEEVRRVKYQANRLSAADLWIYPLPENIGLKMDVDDGLRVKSVVPESPAARVGILADDELVLMNGQRLISQADLQWALHNAPVETQLTTVLKRAGQSLQKTITLSGSWKETDLSWRESSWALRPGLQTVPLSPEQKQTGNISADALALRVKWILPKAAYVKEAGLREGDLIVAVDGKTAAMNESQWLAYVRLNHRPGDTVRLTLRRGSQTEDVLLPVK